MSSLTSFGQAVHGRRWKSSLCTLYKQPTLLVSSILFPCGAYYKAAASFELEKADWCESTCGGVCCFCGFDLRSRFREKYNLRGNELQDFCIHCWCNCCGLAQIQREAKLWNAEVPNPTTPPSPRPGHRQTESQIPFKNNTDPARASSPVSPRTMQRRGSCFV